MARALGTWAVISGAMHCAEPSQTAAQAGVRTLPAYDESSAALFDDAIEPAALGYESDPAEPGLSRRALRERTMRADAVVRARVVTVSSSPGVLGAGWRLDLRPIESLAGASTSNADLALDVKPSDPAARLLGAAEGRLAGLVLVAFVRTFAPSDAGGRGLHFHLARDSKDTVDVVRTASLLDEVK